MRHDYVRALEFGLALGQAHKDTVSGWTGWALRLSKCALLETVGSVL